MIFHRILFVKREMFIITLGIIEILGTLLFFLQEPSESEAAVLFGLSPSRLLVAVIFVALLALGLALLVSGLLKPAYFEQHVSRLKSWLREHGRGTVMFCFLAVLFFLLLGFLLLIYSPEAQNYKTYSQFFVNRLQTYELIRTLVGRSLPLLILILTFLFQGGLWVFFETIYKHGAGPEGVWGKTLLVLAVFIVSLFHWIILVMQIRVFMNISGWYWDLIPKAFGGRDLVFLVMLGLTIWLVRTVLHQPESVRRNMWMVFVLGWALQVGFGVIEGQGFESLRLKYSESHHRSHAVAAAKSTRSLIETVRNYEEIYEGAGYQQTKPPGTILVYIALKDVSDYFFPRDTVQGRFDVLTTVESYLFPLVSFVVVFLIYKVAWMILPGDAGILPSLLYVLIPNVILIPLFLDEVLYPLLFTLGVLVILYAVEMGSFAWGVIGGAIIYGIIFFSFSMLPLIPFAFLYIGLQFLSDKEKLSLKKSLLLGGGIVLGLALMLGLFYVTLNYNIFVRYQHAMAGVRNFDFVARVGVSSADTVENTSFFMKPNQILSAFLLNNVEFASAIGFPLYLLFIIQAIRTIVAVVKKQTTSGGIILLTYFGTFVSLNIFAPIQGEAARLWLFWTPMFALFAGSLIPKIFSRYPRFVTYFAILQIMNIYLIYKFQDLAV